MHDASGPPETAFIVGFNYSHVAHFARDDLGWAHLEKGVWQDDDGRLVRYVRHASDFDGRPSGVRVYLVGAFDQREDWWTLDDAIRERGCERHYL